MIDYPYQYLPPLDAETRENLKQSLREQGVLVPIEKDEAGNTLDGHHRLSLCEELGITDYPVAIRVGMSESEKIRYTISINENRRRPDENNKKFAALKLRDDGRSLRDIAEMVGVSHEAIRKWLPTVNQVDSSEETPEEQRIVGRDGKSRPARIPKTITARNAKEEQKAVAALNLIGWDKDDGETQTAGEIILEAKQAQREVMHSAKREQALPPGRFQVIYADPPWRYENSGFDTSADAHYPTMAIEDICALPIDHLTTDTSILFLWATNPLLPEALRVLQSWGFEYKTNIAWVKEAGKGIGWFLKSKHELLLIGVKSNTPHPAERPESAFEAHRGNIHSRKPKRAYEIIEAMYPGAKVELFARVARDGWSLWGNENDVTIDMATGELLEVSA